VVEHGGIRYALDGFSRAVDHIEVFTGQEAFGNNDGEISGPGHKQEKNHDHGPLVAQHNSQAAGVNMFEALLQVLKHVEEAAVLDLVMRLQEPAAQHGRERQGYDARHQDGRNNGHREFVQQAAQNSAHEEYGNKHGAERDRHGQDGEADLLRSSQRRLHHSFPALHVPDDVLQHDDGIVHDEAHAKSQRHQRQVIERIAAQIHHAEGAYQGERQGQAWNGGRANVAQEKEDDHHHQEQRQLQRKLHIIHRLPNRD